MNLINWSSVMIVSTLLFLGCDDSSKDPSALVGTWQRTQETTTSDTTTLVKVWTITFREDGSFTESHKSTPDLEKTPLKHVKIREGTFNVSNDNVIVMQGNWLDTSEDIRCLDDFGKKILTFERTTTLIFDKSGDVLFLGPDFRSGYSYDQNDSNFILRATGQNSYARSSSLILKSGDEVLEERIESAEITISDSFSCKGSMSSIVTNPTFTTETGGIFTQCSYIIEDNVTILDPTGSEISVGAISFDYEIGDNSETEHYVSLGEDEFIGFIDIKNQHESLYKSAFIRQ